MALVYDGEYSSDYPGTPTPRALRPSQLPPVPESARLARQHTSVARLRLERMLDAAKRLRSEPPSVEECPETQRSPDR